MIIIAEDKTLKMNDVLSYPFGPLPWALPNPYKSSLAKSTRPRLFKGWITLPPDKSGAIQWISVKKTNHGIL